MFPLSQLLPLRGKARQVIGDDAFGFRVFFAGLMFWLLSCISSMAVAHARGVAPHLIWRTLLGAAFGGPLIGLGLAFTLPSPSVGNNKADANKLIIAMLPSLIGLGGTIVTALSN